MRWTWPCLALLALVGMAKALVMAPPPMPERVALADCIVIGKITALEPKPVKAKQFPNSPDATEFTIAIIQVEQGLKGAKGLTHVRLGFVPPPPTPAPQPGAPIRPGIGGNRFPQLNHKVGQEAVFFLTQHAEQNFHVAPMYFDVIDKNSTTLAKDLDTIKKCAKLLEDPMASLKSANAADRLEAAAMLLARYRSIRPGQKGTKQEPIPAEESKLILDALRTADWEAASDFNKVNPMLIFQRLGLSAQDGWNPPKFKNFSQEFPPVAQKWLRDHAATYRIKKFAD